MDPVPAPRHRSRWSFLSLLIFVAPLAILNPAWRIPSSNWKRAFAPAAPSVALIYGAVICAVFISSALICAAPT